MDDPTRARHDFDAFISHSSADAHFADELAQQV